jgi:hypothetical protein
MSFMFSEEGRSYVLHNRPCLADVSLLRKRAPDSASEHVDATDISGAHVGSGASRIHLLKEPSVERVGRLGAAQLLGRPEPKANECELPLCHDLEAWVGLDIQMLIQMFNRPLEISISPGNRPQPKCFFRIC